MDNEEEEKRRVLALKIREVCSDVGCVIKHPSICETEEDVFACPLVIKVMKEKDS